MRMKRLCVAALICAIALFLASCGQRGPELHRDDWPSHEPYTETAEPLPTEKPDDGIIRNIYEITKAVCDGMPEYRFVAEGFVYDGAEPWNHGFITGLQVCDENGNIILDVDFADTDNDIPGNASYMEMMDTMGLHITDVNFDGYRDVIILDTFAGAHANSWYDCWLWDADAGKFVHCPSFSQIVNPALDREKQCIYSTGGMGAYIQEYAISRYINKEFIVTSILQLLWEYDDDDNEWLSVTEMALVDGEMKTLREETLPGDTEWNDTRYNDDGTWDILHPRWYGMGGHLADEWLE